MTRTTLPPPAKGFLEAINRNDTDAFLAYFPHDGVVDDWGTRYVGHARIRAWSDREFIGAQVRLDVTGAEQSGREIRIAAQVGGNGFNGPSHFTFRVGGDRVARMTIRA
jgi:hypothetical protein